jgi:hypothetical protein
VSSATYNIDQIQSYLKDRFSFSRKNKKISVRQLVKNFAIADFLQTIVNAIKFPKQKKEDAD